MVSGLEPEAVREFIGRDGFHDAPLRVIAQLFTLTAFHVTVVEPPDATRVGEAVMVTADWTTVTVACAGDEDRPFPLFVQVI